MQILTKRSLLIFNYRQGPFLRKEKIMKKYKKHVRAANMLLQALYGLKQERFRQIQKKLEEFSCKCTEADKNSHSFNAAADKGWYLAAKKITSRVGRNLNDFSHHLDQFKNFIATDDIKLPTLGDVVAGMLQIEQEYGDIKFDLKAKTVSVITDTIVLEDISFGAFEIRLFINEIKKLHAESPYKLIALEPNPAGSDDEVTHPHVSHEKLCEGDGFIPIRKAIGQGRLCDFFTIIIRILQTYNPDSPYVALSDWEGTSCYDCGYTVAGDDCYYCENCERDYCSQCSTYCQICDSTICLGCAYECPVCKKPVCRHCTAVCKDCDETLCTDCINEEGLCQSCEEKRKDQDNEEQKENTTEPKAGAAVKSDSMGETIVHA